jgi:hypothetical protein
MDAIPNKWIEKISKKKVHETESAYTSDRTDSYAIGYKKGSKRHDPALKATMIKTIRGIRK